MPGWHKTSRHARGYGSQWVRTRDAILYRDGYLCQSCQRNGRPTPATAVDHIVPKASGGTDHPDNLEATCAPCHAEKTAREAAEAQGRTWRPKRIIGADGWPVN